MTSKGNIMGETQLREARAVEVAAWLQDHQVELERLNTQRDALDQQFRWVSQSRGSSPTSERERIQSVHEIAQRFAEIESAIITRSIAAGTLRLEMLPDAPDPIELARAEEAATEAIAIRDALRRQALESQRDRDQIEAQLRSLRKQAVESAAKVEVRRRRAAQAGQQGPLATKRLVIAS
jgi:hypothetical protein